MDTGDAIDDDIESGLCLGHRLSTTIRILSGLGGHLADSLGG